MKKLFTSKLQIILSSAVSFLFALTALLDSNLTYCDDIFATALQIHFNPYTGRDFVRFFIYFIIGLIVINALFLLQSKIHIRYEYDAQKPDKKAYIIWGVIFITLIIAWLPYILSYFPGGVYPDTATSIGQARNNTYNNQQPILYALIFKLCITLAGEINAVMLFSVMQAVFMAACFGNIIFRLYLHRVNIPVLVFVYLYFALFNLVPLYVVSIWKDSIFSIVLLMYIFTLTEYIILSKNPPSVKNIIKITVWMVLAVFLRNNAIYVMLLTLLSLLILYRKNVLKEMKSFFMTTAAALIICFIIQGPVFSKNNLNGPFVENLGVLQQQTAYVQVIGGDMNKEQAEFLSCVCPLDIMKGYYRPLITDPVKWCPEYDNEFLERNKGKFIKVWAGMIKENPKLYADAYLYITLGYWNPFKQSSVSYVNPEMWHDLKDIDRYWQKDLIEILTGSSIRSKLAPKTLISSAVFLFITLALLVLAINKKDASFASFVPALNVYLTVLIATPLAFALRYVYIVVLTVPLYFIVSFIKPVEKR